MFILKKILLILAALINLSAQAQEVYPVSTDVLITPAVINDKAYGTFVVDTGSSYVTISKQLANILKIKPDKSAPYEVVVTASGTEFLQKVTLESLTVNNVRIENVPAVIKDFENDPMLSGLLGMSFLGRVNVKILKGSFTIEGD